MIINISIFIDYISNISFADTLIIIGILVACVLAVVKAINNGYETCPNCGKSYLYEDRVNNNEFCPKCKYIKK